MLRTSLQKKWQAQPPDNGVTDSSEELAAQLPVNRKRKVKPPARLAKKTRQSVIPIANDFDEAVEELAKKFQISTSTLKKAVDGLINFTSSNPKLKNRLFEGEQFPIYLQVNCIKVTKGISKIMRIPLKHSMYTENSDVCLIVSEIQGVTNKNHDEHLEHYRKLLAKKEVNNIKTVMTFHEFRTEYETFELKNRLVNLYDVFLVDGKISGKVVKKCGKIFYKKRKIPTAIKLQATKLKEHIESALRKTSLYFHSNGDSFMVQIGHSKMVIKDLVENILFVVNGLDTMFPGGFQNIRSINLCTFRGLTIPIYTTLKNQNNVVIAKNKKKSVEVVSGELSTRMASGVKVKATGEVTVFKLNSEEESNDSKANPETQDADEDLNSSGKQVTDLHGLRNKKKLKKFATPKKKSKVNLYPAKSKKQRMLNES